jgi:signal transduction histidine kinase
MLNLILNAVEAMSGSSETARELLIRTEQDGPDRVLAAVEDSGLRPKPDSSDRLFEAFYTPKPGGTSMGLSICRSIIEAHAGRVWATANIPRAPSFSSPYPNTGTSRPEQAPAAKRRIIHGLEIGAPGVGRQNLKLSVQVDRRRAWRVGQM